MDVAIPAADPNYYYHYYDQTAIYWNAVGLRSQPGDDWDLYLYDGLGDVPPCVDTLLAYSNLFEGVDFVVSDFNAGEGDMNYLSYERYTGTQVGFIEWDDGPDILYANEPPVHRSTGAEDILEIWDVYLDAGKEYRFIVYREGQADLTLFLFRNPGSGIYHAPRVAAEFSLACHDDGQWTFTADYTAPVSDYYGLVIVNENGLSADYHVSCGTCPVPAALTSGVSVPVSPVWNHHEFTQLWGYWTAVGVRGDYPDNDWNLVLYGNPSGDGWPYCFTGLLGSSILGLPEVDFVAIDCNSGQAPTGTYYINAYGEGGNARVEWDDGADIFPVNGSPIVRETAPEEVLEVWDVYLEENVDYNVVLQGSGANANLVLVEPAPGVDNNYVPRYLAPMEAGPGCTHYSAGIDGYHGLIFVNDDGGTGAFELSVAEQLRAVDAMPLGDTLNARGASFGDYDGDGDVDLYITNYGVSNLLLRNDGETSFTDVTPGVLSRPSMADLEGIWGDYDNDGDLDIFVVNNLGTNGLYRNDGGGAFSDVTPAYLTPSSANGLGASWADYDRDGLIDLFLANGLNDDRLFHNEGEGSFTVALLPALPMDHSLAAVWGDYDFDGDPDLLLVRQTTLRLLRNDEGSFIDVTAPPLDAVRYWVSAAWVDYDNDEDLDLYVSADGPNALFANQGGGTFVDATPPALADTILALTLQWADYDHDGRIDLYLPGYDGPDRLLRQEWDGNFVDVLSAGISQHEDHQDLTVADVDGDGDRDFYEVSTKWGASAGAPNRLVRNDLCTGSHWVELRFVGLLSNRFGAGTRVRVTAGGLTQVREVVGHPADCDYRVHFGLGSATIIDLVQVYWPSGYVQQIEGLAPDQPWTIYEEDVLTAVESISEPDVPKVLALHRSVPNPFNPATTISYDLPTSSEVSLTIYGVTGRLVRTLVDGELQKPGSYRVVWDGRNDRGEPAPSGFYFSRLLTEEGTMTGRLVLIR